MKDLPKFRGDHYEYDDNIIMAMKELNHRRLELKMMYDKFYSVWILGKMKKQKKMEGFEI